MSDKSPDKSPIEKTPGVLRPCPGEGVISFVTFVPNGKDIPLPTARPDEPLGVVTNPKAAPTKEELDAAMDKLKKVVNTNQIVLKGLDFSKYVSPRWDQVHTPAMYTPYVPDEIEHKTPTKKPLNQLADEVPGNELGAVVVELLTEDPDVRDTKVSDAKRAPELTAKDRAVAQLRRELAAGEKAQSRLQTLQYAVETVLNIKWLPTEAVSYLKSVLENSKR